MGTAVIVRMKENEFHNICVSTAINKDLEKRQQLCMPLGLPQLHGVIAHPRR